MSFFNELKRRNVFRVGIAYLVTAWVLLQVTEVLTELLELNTDIGKTVIVLLLIGFIPTLIFAWAFELTPEGLKRDAEVDRSDPALQQSGRRLDRVIIAVLVVALGYFIYESRFQSMDTGTTAPAQPAPPTAIPPETGAPPPPATVTSAPQGGPINQRSVAVLPFLNMSSDQEQEYFSDGITEEIINAVVKIPGVAVPARTTVFAYKNHQGDLREVGRLLGVAHILEGSIRSQGDQVRVTAQLIKVDDGFHLWSETFDRRLDNIFAVQEEIAAAIARQLTGEFQPQIPTVPNQTRNMAAYDLYLQGRAALRRRDDASRDLFLAAIEADPDFAPAYAALAIAYNSTNEDNDRAIEMAEKALAIDPENVDALNALGGAYRTQRRWLESERLLEKALALDPNSAELLEDYAEFLAYTGQTREALTITTRGIGLDPALLPLAAAHAEALLSNDKPRQAYAFSVEMMRANPQFKWVWYLLTPVWFDPSVYGFNQAFPPPPVMSAEDFQRRPEWLPFSEDIEPIARRVLAGTPAAGDIEMLKQRYSVENMPDGPADIARDLLVILGEIDHVIAADISRVETLNNPLIEWNWAPLYRPLRQHPEFPRFLELLGLIDYWDATQWPEHCARDINDVVRCT